MKLPDGNAYVAQILEWAQRMSKSGPLSEYMRGYSIGQIATARTYFGATDGVCDVAMLAIRELCRERGEKVTP